MPRWLDLDETLTSEQSAALVDGLLTGLEVHMNPVLAHNMRVLGEDFTEWRASGCHVYDPQGRAYFDAVGAGGVFGLGHSHPRVVDAVRRQLERGALSVRMGLVPGQLELLERLARVAPPGLVHGFLGSSGTEAVEAALKLARLATGRPGLVGMEMGYHGMSIATLSVSGIPYWKDGFPPLLEPCRLVPFGDLAAAEKAVDSHTAAVILEPVQWASGCTVAPPDYLRGLRRLCDERGALLILDEIQTGLGRTGRWWGADHAGVVPDLLCVGKVLSGGVVPVSALLYNARVQAVAAQRTLFNNSTFGGSPLACAAAVATLDVLESEGLVHRAAELGQRLEAGLNGLQQSFPALLAFQRGQGMMRCLFTRDPRYGMMISATLMREHRVLLPSMAHAPHVLRMSPPFVATDGDLGRMFTALEASCAAVREMGLEGITAYMQDVARRLGGS